MEQRPTSSDIFSTIVHAEPPSFSQDEHWKYVQNAYEIRYGDRKFRISHFHSRNPSLIIHTFPKIGTLPDARFFVSANHIEKDELYSPCPESDVSFAEIENILESLYWALLSDSAIISMTE